MVNYLFSICFNCRFVYMFYVLSEEHDISTKEERQKQDEEIKMEMKCNEC